MKSAVPVLRTPRLTLRPLVDEDAEAIVAGVGNYDVSKWLSVVPYPYKLSDARQFLRELDTPVKYPWAICDAHGLQGIISIEAELGYWLARPAWGKGYGFEAAHAVVSWWFSDPDAGPLKSGFFDGNARSGRVLSALGFQVSDRQERKARAYGQMVPSTGMILTRHDWMERQAFRLDTGRLTLRPLSLEEANLLLPLGDIAVTRQTASLITDWDVDQARDWLDQRRWKGRASGMLGVFRQEDFVGMVGGGGYPSNIGWMIVPEHWGNGYATEAVSAFVAGFFDRTTFSTLVSDIFVDNPMSIAVARKVGFQETGRDTGTSRGRLEPQSVITYALRRDSLKGTL